ncbi:O-antigen ligase family protein [Candidatus Pseudothioglobus singularis]|nr:O-antigen ligase family protein [Candidatus Pseudothioglobus singularis]
MVALIKDFNLNKIYQILLIMLAFLMPLTVFGANLIIVIICLLWLFSGDYKSKYSQIVNSKLLLASIFFFSLHVIGLLWTEDIAWGLHIIHKMWYFLLLLPALYTIVQKEYIKYYISAFLLAITFTEIASYLVWFEIIEPFKNATVENPTPFMSHVSYNPILTLAIYLVLHEIFFNKKITNLVFTLYGFFSLSMSINMFITGGRAGQVAFFVMLSILIFQVFDKQRIKSLITIFIVVPVIFSTAYQVSNLFQDRVNIAIAELVNYSNTAYTSVGLRLTYTINSFEVIKKYPILGIGTGDFPVEYSRVNQINTPTLPNSTNPHNMYILILMQLGLVGLISMLAIFYYQIKFSYNSSNKLIRDTGLTLPLIFLVLMLSDSYLLGHYTTLVFVFFSSFLYKNFEKF